MFRFSLRMKKADMLGNTGPPNHSHRTAQEMLELFLASKLPSQKHCNCHFYWDLLNILYSVWGWLAPTEIPWCQLTWNMKYNLANSAARPIPLFLEENLYIVVQIKVRDNKDKQIPCLGLVIITLLAQQSTGLCYLQVGCWIMFVAEKTLPLIYISPLKHFDPRVDPFFLIDREARGTKKSPKIALYCGSPITKKYVHYS